MARHRCDHCRGGYHYRNPGLYHQLLVLWNPVLQRLLQLLILLLSIASE